jgi:hypothetical protein
VEEMNEGDLPPAMSRPNIQFLLVDFRLYPATGAAETGTPITFTLARLFCAGRKRIASTTPADWLGNRPPASA